MISPWRQSLPLVAKGHPPSALVLCRGLHNVFIESKPVEHLVEPFKHDSTSSLRQLINGHDAVPLLFRSPSGPPGPPSTQLSRAKQLVNALKQSGDTLVEVEHGRYDQAATGPGSFDRVEMPLGYYIDWLENNESAGGLVGGKQLYLAQWRPGNHETGVVQGLIKKPAVLPALEQDCTIDSYGNNFFIGPTGVVTPLHYDPYINLFHLQASSCPGRIAKHVTLFPPSLSHLLKRETSTALRNTSLHEFSLHHNSRHHYTFDVRLENSAGLFDETIREMSKHALTCIVHEGDTLLIPKRWWHRVENVDLFPDSAEKKVGWTAALSWWFLLKNTLRTHNGQPQ